MRWKCALLMAALGSAAVAQQAPPAGPGAGAGGTPVNRPGGISHVTRPTPQVRSGIAAASFFTASGVPLSPSIPANPASGNAPAGPLAVRPAAPVEVSRRLQALADSGDSRAKSALTILRAMPPRPAAVRANRR